MLQLDVSLGVKLLKCVSHALLSLTDDMVVIYLVRGELTQNDKRLALGETGSGPVKLSSWPPELPSHAP